MKIAVLPGDGIGPEIVAEAVKVLNTLGPEIRNGTGPGGGAASRPMATRCPSPRLEPGQEADAVLFGAVGDWKYDKLRPPAVPPEQAILGLRKNLGLFANFRPAICYEQLTARPASNPN